MCPSYKWPVLLRWMKSGDTLSEVTVLEVTPCEISFISFLHSTNLNPENSPTFCDLYDFQPVLLPHCGRTSCASCRHRHSDGCQQSSIKLCAVSHLSPPHPIQQSGTKQGGHCRHPLSKWGHQEIWTEQTLESTWLSFLYTVASFCFLRLKLPLGFRRAWL